MPSGRPNTSGKSHNKSSKTYLTAGRDQASFLLLEHHQLLINVDITEEPLTTVPPVKIENEEGHLKLH